jgi:hypothetical protein
MPYENFFLKRGKKRVWSQTARKKRNRAILSIFYPGMREDTDLKDFDCTFSSRRAQGCLEERIIIFIVN